MSSKISFTVQLNKSDWKPDKQVWYMPILILPGIRVHEVKTKDIRINNTDYRVNYFNQFIEGDGVQHFDELYVKLYLTFRLSTWLNVMLTGIVGITGMLLLFMISTKTFSKNDTPVINDTASTHKSTDSSITDSQLQKAIFTDKETKVPKITIPHSTLRKSLNDPLKREIIVLIGNIPDSAGGNGKPLSEEYSLTQQINEILERKQCKATNFNFRSSIFFDGTFQQMLNANFTTFSLDSLNDIADEICIGTVWRSVRPAISQKNMFIAEIHIHLKFISTENGRVLKPITITRSSKASFSQEKALQQANENLKLYLNKIL
jgi:hypothetical protein